MILASAALTAPAVAAPPVPDPYFVLYSDERCHSDILEVEVWDRGAKRWRPHPVHPQKL
jgi:hypothetical protein